MCHHGIRRAGLRTLMFFVLILVSVISGCGQRGALYLPESTIKDIEKDPVTLKEVDSIQDNCAFSQTSKTDQQLCSKE